MFWIRASVSFFVLCIYKLILTTIPSPVYLPRPTIRMCPGRHMAFNSLFIAVASVLSMFEIKKPLDKNGHPITVADEVTSEFAS